MLKTHETARVPWAGRGGPGTAFDPAQLGVYLGTVIGRAI